MVISMLESMTKEHLMVMGNIIGHREVTTRVNSRMGLDKVMEFGRRELGIVISTKGIISMIRSKVTEYTLGNLVIYIKEIMRMI